MLYFLIQCMQTEKVFGAMIIDGSDVKRQTLIIARTCLLPGKALFANVDLVCYRTTIVITYIQYV